MGIFIKTLDAYTACSTLYIMNFARDGDFEYKRINPKIYHFVETFLEDLIDIFTKGISFTLNSRTTSGFTPWKVEVANHVGHMIPFEKHGAVLLHVPAGAGWNNTRGDAEMLGFRCVDETSNEKNGTTIRIYLMSAKDLVAKLRQIVEEREQSTLVEEVVVDVTPTA